jgi:hypothetical protein
VTWLDWLRLGALFLAFGGIGASILIGFFWLCSKPLGSGPERIVDVKNRGHTKIRMPDGTIR